MKVMFIFFLSNKVVRGVVVREFVFFFAIVVGDAVTV